MRINRGMNHDAFKTQLVAGPHDTTRNGAAIGDEYFANRP
jgi:hypothetical protein